MTVYSNFIRNSPNPDGLQQVSGSTACGEPYCSIIKRNEPLIYNLINNLDGSPESYAEWKKKGQFQRVTHSIIPVI